MPANRELLPSDWAIPYAMACTLTPYLTSRFSQFLFQFTISHSITVLLFQIIARICTYVNINIRIRTYPFRRIVKIATQGRTLSPTVFYPPQIGTSTRWGEFRGWGLTFFISELETTPLPFTVYAPHTAWNVGMAGLVHLV